MRLNTKLSCVLRHKHYLCSRPKRERTTVDTCHERMVLTASQLLGEWRVKQGAFCVERFHMSLENIFFPSFRLSVCQFVDPTRNSQSSNKRLMSAFIRGYYRKVKIYFICEALLAIVELKL